MAVKTMKLRREVSSKPENDRHTSNQSAQTEANKAEEAKSDAGESSSGNIREGI